MNQLEIAWIHRQREPDSSVSVCLSLTVWLFSLDILLILVSGVVLTIRKSWKSKHNNELADQRSFHFKHGRRRNNKKL